MLHTTAHERYQKLKRVFARLIKNFNRDDVDEFIQTANSLREWIQRDRTLTRKQRNAAEAFAVPRGVDWQMWYQIAQPPKTCRPQDWKS